MLVGCGGHAVRGGLIHVGDVGGVFVDDDVVVVIIYNRVVHGGVGDVHVCHVSATDVIRRLVDFTRREREPGYPATASSDSNANAEMGSANPGDKSGSVNRAHVLDIHLPPGRARHPAPHATHSYPAAVMERRKAPGSIINPGPAPGRNPHPVAIAIRRPTDDGGVGEPNGAVLGHRGPATVVVEIFIANHIGRDVARGLRAVFAAVAVTRPTVEVVIVIAESLNVGVELVGTGKRAGFPSMNGISGATTGDFAFTVANGHEGGIAGFADIDLVVARPKDGEVQVGGIDFESFVLIETPHAHIKGAFGKADLGHAVVQIQKRKTSVAGKTDRRGANVQLGAGAVVGPKLVASGNRTVDDRGNPIVGAPRVERNGAVSVAEASDAAWRIVIVGCGALRRKESHR